MLGYGSQGRAHALNLRDSGCDVRVGLRPGSRSIERAEHDGLSVSTLAEAAQWGEVVSLMLPDPIHRQVYEEAVGPNLAPGDLIVVAHGFSVLYGQIRPASDVDVVLVAPTSPGNAVRDLYVAGHGIPAYYAVWQDATGTAGDRAIAYALALGCDTAAILPTTFRDETEVDLFGEQVVVVGGVSSLVQAAFDTLVDAGYSAQMAYFECLHQLVLLTELMQRRGIAGMYRSISTTAAYGGLTVGPRIIDEHARASMRQALQEIRDGTFARAWIAESEEDGPQLKRLIDERQRDPIEEVGGALRAVMPWLSRPDEPSA